MASASGLGLSIASRILSTVCSISPPSLTRSSSLMRVAGKSLARREPRLCRLSKTISGELISRRKIFQYSSVLGAIAARGRARAAALNPDTLIKFVDRLPVPATARVLGRKPVPGRASEQAPYYRVAMQEIRCKLHRDLPPARLWSYGGSVPGPTFEMRRGEGALIEWVNDLPSRHFLPVDHRLHGAERDKPEVRAVVHVHGAKVPPGADGYPERWYVPGKSAVYHYPNRQDAATLWYHDHAMGINRLNIYAGLFGFFLIRDAVEDALNLPKGPYEIPLVIYDRSFRENGRLDYPVSG